MNGSIPSVVLDCGSSHLRAGYGGEHGPRLDIPTLVGYQRHRGVAMAAGMNEQEVGEEALLKQGVLDVHEPIHNGIVENWDDMERLWAHVFFSELRVSPETHRFVVTQPVNAPAAQKERTLEVMMETFSVDSLYLATSQVLSLYSYGLTTGLVVDCGKTGTRAVPVHEGYALGRHVTSSPVGGETITNYLGLLLRKQGYALGTPTERMAVDLAKECLCYVRPSPYATGPGSVTAQDAFLRSRATEMDAMVGGDADFALPDGQRVPLRSERADAAEVLFDFSLLDDLPENEVDGFLHHGRGAAPAPTTRASSASSRRGGSADPRKPFQPRCKVRTDMGEVFKPTFSAGLSWLPFAAVHNCEPSLRNQLYANIVLAGHTLALPGARDRLEAELVELYRQSHPSEAVPPVHVKDTSARGYSAWLGGSMLADTAMFNELVVSRKEYSEEGARVIHCKSL